MKNRRQERTRRSDAKNQDRPETSRYSSNPEALHRIMFEEAVDGIFITDPQGRFVAVNPRGIELTGYSREELLDLNFTDLIPLEWYGPIVMNTQEELQIAFEEYRQGTFIKYKG